MSRVRALAPAAAALAVAATLADRFGLAHAAVLAEAAIAVFVLAVLPRLSRLAQVLLAVMAATLAAALLREGAAPLRLSPALFAFAFILSTGFLREIALRDPAFQALGDGLRGLDGRRRFPVVSLAVALSGLTLLIGALQFLAGLVAKERDAAGRGARVAAIRAGIAGYLLIPLLSPLAIPFIVVSNVVPDLVWAETFPILFAIAVATWAFAYAQDRFGRAGAPLAGGGGTRLPVAVMAKAVAPVLLAAALHLGGGLALDVSAMLAVCAAAILWALRLGDAGVVAEGLVSARNEAVIIGASVATGLALVTLAPGVGQSLPIGGIPMALLAPALFLGFIAGGLAGLQPALCFMLSTPVLAAATAARPDETAPLLAAAMAGWALNSVTSPFGLPILIAARALGTSSAAVLFRLNLPYTLAVPALGALVLAFAGLR